MELVLGGASIDAKPRCSPKLKKIVGSSSVNPLNISSRTLP
jgi:hypothetical protein